MGVNLNAAVGLPGQLMVPQHNGIWEEQEGS